ncbi:MAG: SBBP repeat-containing protein, partial [Candidatus Hodarchaeota archaeon]
MNYAAKYSLKYFSRSLYFLILFVLLLESLSPIFFMRITASSCSNDVMNPQKPEFPSEIEKVLFKPSIELPSKLPFSGFIENKGQVDDPKILYYYSNSEMSVGFGKAKIMFVSAFQNDIAGTSFSLTFPEATLVTPVGKGEKNHPTNYYYGAFHFTNVLSWDEIWYYDLYPQIDLRYYMTTEGLKYEFIVRPGGNPAQITVKVNGAVTLDVQAQKVTINSQNPRHKIKFQDSQLHVFQADKTPIKAQFLSKNPKTYGFYLGNFDPTQPLIIDPQWLFFSTYLGGSGSETWHYDTSITVDGAGNSYITGATGSTDFPTYNAYNDTHGGGFDVFVTKLNATGTGFLYSTYLGGSDWDFSYGIAVDTDNNCYITGYTYSADFPTVNAYDDTIDGSTDAFVTKLNATGNGLVYSTYLGGSDWEEGYDLTIDSAGNCYITGWTESTDFPTVNAFNDTYGGWADVFVTKLNATGTELVYSTYLGGQYEDKNWGGIAIDSEGNCYITGYTDSDNFPTTPDAFARTLSGVWFDVFVTLLNASGNSLVYSTYLGGSDWDQSFDLAIDSAGNCYVIGPTDSDDFPTLNAFNDTYSGAGDVFVAKINMTGNLVFSTYVGGSGTDFGIGIEVDSAGNSYITGWTRSDDFPT